MALLSKARARRLTKKMLNQWETDGTKKFKDAATKAQANDALREAMSVELASKLHVRQLAGDKRVAVVLNRADDTPVLTCLWENREEILKFFMTILAMFP